MKKIVTLVFVRRGNEILLGMKKRGFGEGRWNGFGGKIEPGETKLEGVQRELIEESGLTGNRFEEIAHIFFDFETTPDEIDCTVFFCDDYSGEPIETDEMRPQWFRANELPYSEMWIDDKYWLPLALAGKKLEAIFHFKNQSELGEYTITQKQG
jgi:8-oxo-dGTP diphosphatase/2-hydroxy-dATP diphosphatase